MTTPTTPPPRHIAHVHYHGLTPADPRYPQVLDLLATISARLQALAPDAALADISGAEKYFERGPEGLTQLIRLRTLAWTGVTTTIGAGSSVMLAAMAAAVTEPGGITVIPDTDEAIVAFLHPRPTAALPGVGPATARTLAHHGLETVGDIARTPLATLQRLLGAAAGRQLHEHAHAHDPRTVVPHSLPKTTSVSHGFDRDELDPDQHHRALLALTHQLGARLRDDQVVARTLTLTVRYADRTTTSRTRTLAEATAHTLALTRMATSLYEALGLQRARVRGLSLTAELTDAAAAVHQLTFDPGDTKARCIESAADRARQRFGTDAVVPAALAGRRGRR
ncbi:helix-hairpin-helix domain-containing protein [Streptomyces sp. NPDC058371]|uniref:DNA polymerase Y family protein n=1 Tax=Streptomyces sp. NPDC058371 TaxID=3346463 RepID=UPI0036550A17